MQKSYILTVILVFVVAVSSADIVHGKPVARTPPISGKIVAKRAGETAVLVPVNSQRPVEVRQDLKSGDILRTNARGQLAIAFTDGTQMRLARNTTLRVKLVNGGSPTSMSLDRGRLWIRAPRNRSRLTVETAAAAASIRGTSWSINVFEDRSTIEVFEGSVLLSNPQGSLQVDQGQIAAAKVGEAPTRLAIVQSDERRQLFYYMPVGDIIRNLPAPGFVPADARSSRSRILSINPSQRSAEDWLSLAETSAGLDSDHDRAGYLAEIDHGELDVQSRARFALVEALLLAGAGNLTGAKEKLAADIGALRGQRRVVAAYLGAMAENHSAVDLSDQPSEVSGANSIVMLSDALLAAYNGDLERAIEIAKSGERQFPEVVSFPLVVGQIAILLGDRELLQEAIKHSNELDPGHYSVYLLRSFLNGDYDNDRDAALSDALHATKLAPGNQFAWGVLARVHMLQQDYRAADNAYLKAIETGSENAGIHANRALNLMEQRRFRDAESELNRAEAIDPSNPALLTFRGRLALQRGKRSEAEELLVDALAAQPNFAPALLLYADVLNGNGDTEVAEQQLDAAARYDPKSELPEIYRSAFALDANLPEKALNHARAAHSILRSVDSATFQSESAKIDSYAANSLNFLGLDRWARFYSDRSFSTTNAAALFARSNVNLGNPYLLPRHSLSKGDSLDLGPPAPTPTLTPTPPNVGVPQTAPDIVPLSTAISTASLAPVGGNARTDPAIGNFSSFNAQVSSGTLAKSFVLAGLALEPLAIARPRRYLSFLNEEFFEVSARATGIVANGHFGNAQSIDLSGVLLGDTPFAYSFNLAGLDWIGANGVRDDRSRTELRGAVGMEISPVDSLSLQMSRTDSNSARRDTLERGFSDTLSNLSSTSITASYGHVISPGTIAMLGGNYTKSGLGLKITNDLQLPYESLDDNVESQQLSVGISSQQQSHSVNVGIDYVRRTLTGVSIREPAGTTNPASITSSERRQSREELRLRANLGVKVTGRLSADLLVGYINSGGEEHVEYGTGLTYAMADRHVVRLAYENMIHSQTSFTYAPRNLAGLFAYSAPTRIGDGWNAMTVRWDSEWSDRFFTAVEFQRLGAKQFRYADFDRINFRDAKPSVIVGTGPLNRIALSADILLPENLGISLRYARSFADNHLFLPKHFARIGLVWSDESRFRASTSLTYASERKSGLGLPVLKDYISVDMGLSWNSRDGRFEASADIFNLFDTPAEFSVDNQGYGRAFITSVTSRF